MNILAFESSCDETAAAVVRDGRQVLSDAILSQADMHAVYGGVVPEIASRKHVEAIAGLADKALADAGLRKTDVDAVAVTYGPGLIGALLVGVNFAKRAALALGRPLIPVHHLRGHIAANYIAFPELEPPFLALCISGGNSMIVDVRDYTDMTIMGATRDDAAGECFDKIARVLGLPYPGGKPMQELARGGGRREVSPAQGQGGGEPAGHVLLRAEDGGGKPDPQRRSEGGGAGPVQSGGVGGRGYQRGAGTPGHRGRPAAGPPRPGRSRRRGCQREDSGGFGAGLPGQRYPAVPSAPAPVRRQWGHDRRTGLLRVSGRRPGGRQPECLREFGDLR